MFKIKFFEEVTEFILILTILVVGIYVIHFLITAGKKNAKDAPHALGLPAGSVRATLAMTLIIFFVLIAVYFYLQTDDLERKYELGQGILTILGTLVVSVSAFYFGIKATQQGSKIAMDSFKEMNTVDAGKGNVPSEVILEAIKNNKDNWMQQYGCIDIKPGKKTSGNTNFELNCLVFYVVTKDISLDETNSIPPFIAYNSKGTDYEIPTDVELEEDKGSPNDYKSLSEEEKYNLIDEFIELKIDSFLETYPNATGAYASRKKINDNETEIICLVVQFPEKTNLAEPPLPQFIEYKHFQIPTDIEVATQTELNFSETELAKGASRIDDNDFGTLGFAVNFKNEIHILSCYHVLFYKEMKAGAWNINDGAIINNADVLSPSLKHSTTNKLKVGKVICGEVTNYLDVAILKPTSDFLNQLSEENLCKSYRTLTRRDERKTILRFRGRGSNRTKETKLLNIFTVQPIPYKGLGIVRMKGLIQMEKCAVGGDSGAAVYDLSDKIVGIIVGSDSRYTYAISTYNIFNKSNYNLI